MALYVCKKLILNTFRHFCLQVLSDVISIMSYEVKPELAAQPHPQSGQPLRWMPKICLTSPATCAMVPIGMCGVIKVQNKMLLVLQVGSLIQCLPVTSILAKFFSEAGGNNTENCEKTPLNNCISD